MTQIFEIQHKEEHFKKFIVILLLCRNLLLMASSNGTEIGVLGTTESGETPLWKQFTFVRMISEFNSMCSFSESNFEDQTYAWFFCLLVFFGEVD